ncbi:MAG: guanylate kinase, partial [Dehalococcoidia bacterium]|nr:guanylate kinase [Dehalococcoidia bacterium]
MRKPESELSEEPRVKRQGRVFVLSGPSGVGKDAVLSQIRQLERPYYFTTTATTRPMRPGERDGVDYIFLDRDTFQHMIKQGDLLEWA